MGTDPPGGTEVARDSTVRVLVSQGPELIEVPNVSGQNVAQATAALQAAGFRVEVLPAGATGRVIVTDPLPGERRPSRHRPSPSSPGGSGQPQEAAQ